MVRGGIHQKRQRRLRTGAGRLSLETSRRLVRQISDPLQQLHKS
jgi:hypothetical protein